MARVTNRRAAKEGSSCQIRFPEWNTHFRFSPYAVSKGGIEALAKCLELEYRRYGISVHLFHPPLTQTRSSSPLPVPAEFMASPQKVGEGLARHIDSRRFVICRSLWQQFQMRLCYLWPLTMGGLMCRMTERAKNF